jgi:hypothetical protein
MTLAPHLYPIPRERLNGRAAEMAFADAIYCLLAAEGRPSQRRPGAYSFALYFRKVGELSGLDSSTVNEEADQAKRAGWLERSGQGQRDWEEVYLPGYADLAEGRGAPLKPRNYVLNGWLNTVYRLDKSYLLQRVLNLIWLMGFGAEPHAVSVDELRRRASPHNKRPPNFSRLRDKLDTLERLGLLLPEAGVYRLDRSGFDRLAPPPEAVTRRWDRRRLVSTDLYQSLAAIDAQRAELALEVLLQGRFDPEADLEAVFADLRWVGQDLDLLLRLVRGRSKRDGRPDWRGLWRNFTRKRQDQLSAGRHVLSAHLVAPFDTVSYYAAPLALPGLLAGRVRQLMLHARLRASLNGRQTAAGGGPALEARLAVACGQTELLTVELVHAKPLHQHLAIGQFPADTPIDFMVTAYTPTALRGLSLEAWLEAELRQ